MCACVPRIGNTKMRKTTVSALKEGSYIQENKYTIWNRCKIICVLGAARCEMGQIWQGFLRKASEVYVLKHLGVSGKTNGRNRVPDK